MRQLQTRICLLPVLLLTLSGRGAAAGIAKGPYLQNPTPSSITVCWVTDAAVTGAVQFIRGSDKPTTVSEQTPGVYHRLILSRLKPNTYYRYSVACDGATAGGTFRTAATRGRSFHFVAYGDNRTQANVHAQVLRRIAMFGPDFILQTGDMVANGENLAQWDEYWRVAGPTLSSIPIFPSLGNHERNGAPYFQYFRVPRDYSFDYGDVHFVALDSNRTGAEAIAQKEWLRRDLAAHQKAGFRVVFMHHTLHTCVNMPARRLESEQRWKELGPILKAGRVQLVVSGHDHNYQRHEADGITCLVTGGGGAPLYEVVPNTPHVIVARKAYNDCEITVDRDRISVQAVQPDGSVIDQFVIRRNP